MPRPLNPPAVALDFPFTESDTKPARKRIGNDLRVIAREVFAADPHVRALVLTGGFSRGEGTVRDERPVNDYDLVAVRSRPGGRPLYSALHRSLTERVGIEVDLLPVWSARLSRVGRKLFWLDLRIGGRVIAGDEQVLNRLPTFAAGELPEREIARLLGNRAAGLLRAVPGTGLPVDALEEQLQSTKAVLAALDARLLARGMYAVRMLDRLELMRDHPDYDAFAAAVSWKLASSDSQLREALPHDWWSVARDVLLRAVEDTNAAELGDGAVERVYHLLGARRWRTTPSHDVRLATWDVLRQTDFPMGPRDPERARECLARITPVAEASWPALKAHLFRLRAATLQ